VNASADLTNGLSAYYKLDGNAQDETGNHDGTEHGNTYVTGVYGQAASFDGINDYIDMGVTRDILNSQQVSFSYWANMKGMNHWNSVQISSYNGGTFENGDIVLYIYNTNTFGPGYGTGVNQGHISEFKIGFTSNEWVHICVVLDSTQTNSAARKKLYVNGESVPLAKLVQTNDTQGAAIGNTSEIFRMGAFLGFTSRYMEGKLDEVRIYNRVLTDEEIGQLATPSLVALTQGYHVFDVKIDARILGSRDGKSVIDTENIQGLLVYNGNTAEAQFFDIARNEIIVLDADFTYDPRTNNSVPKKGITAQGVACANIHIDGFLDAVTLGYFQLKRTVKGKLMTISLAGAGADVENDAYGAVLLRYNQTISNAMNLAEDAEEAFRAMLLKRTGIDIRGDK
jgi:hypothetical protein